MAITFRKPLLPPMLLNIINVLFGIFFLLFGITIISGIFIIVGQVLTQSYYLLKNENQGQETKSEYFQLLCIYLIIFAVLTKTSSFFERQINKLYQDTNRKKSFKPRLWSKPKVANFILICIAILGALHYFILRYTFVG